MSSPTEAPGAPEASGTPETADPPVQPAEPGTSAFAIDKALERMLRRARARSIAAMILVPVFAVVAALLIGAVLIAREGADPLAVYGEVLRGVFVANRGLRNTAVGATPLVLMGLGLAIAYRARLFTIGAEGQFVIGAVAATAWATAPTIRDLPGSIVIPGAVLFAVLAGAAWSSITTLLNVRYRTSIVISSLLLTYIALSIMQWAVRVGIRDPDSFIPASRQIGVGSLPTLPVLNVHAGFAAVILLGPVLWLMMARTRLGYRVDVLGHNPSALGANETRAVGVMFVVLALAGGLAGLAGYIEVAGVTQRVNSSFSLGFGFTAIIVALLGRLHPIGVVVAGLGLAGLRVGFAVAERQYGLPSSLIGLIIALIIIFVLIGDVIAERLGLAERS